MLDRRLFHTVAGLTALLAAFASPALAAWPNNPFSGGVALCNAANSQNNPKAISDGAGGAIITWVDLRSGQYDIYAQRVSAAGAPLWTAGGVVVTSATGTQSTAIIVPDGANGAIIAWTDFRGGGSSDVYAQRLNGAGVPQWTANGVAVCAATQAQEAICMTPDGSGGAVLAWQDFRSGTNYDIYAQKLSAAGVPAWTANGAALVTLSSMQDSPAIETDGAGGAIVAWRDSRASNSDLYAQRITSAGTVAWAVNGTPLAVATNSQTQVQLASDGMGGAFAVWTDDRAVAFDYDLFMQHITSGGALDWLGSSLVLCNAAGEQSYPAITKDGLGGLVAVWLDYRSTNSDLYAQRVGPNGNILWAANGVAVATTTDSQSSVCIAADGGGGALISWNEVHGGVSYDVLAQRIGSNGVAQWLANGAVISSALSDQYSPTIASDGAGGAIVAWQDQRNVANSLDIYCQRVERYGQLGSPEPVITSAGDVKNDQGGFVKLTWNASYLDADPTFGVSEYRVFRSVPGAQLAAAAAREVTMDSDEAVREGKLLQRPFGATVTTWEFVGTQAAEAFASYSKVVATTADSVGGSNPRTYFMVEARASTSISSDRWSSAPDSGYSVDNLPPVAPAPLTGQYLAGTTQLHWNRNTEGDIAGYRLYRGNNAAFVPGPANFVTQRPDTGAADAAGAPYVYKLTAVDIHGNESPVATLIPSGTLGVGDAPRTLAFAAPSPNPARGTTTLRYSLSTRGAVKLALFDAAGRRVATLADGVIEAGEHSVAFALRDDAGRDLPAGLYLARLDAEGRTLTRRIAAVR